MTQPISIDLPHSLGAEEAQRRIEKNMDKLADHIPGGADIESSWSGNRLQMKVGAMGQQVSTRIDVEERVVRLQVDLPPSLGFFRGMIAGVIRSQGVQMLEDKTKP